jgi:U32 family peptidase
MNTNKKLHIPELLAPAGNAACALAAFDNGADAIYAGLPKFNARERSDNFSLDEMAGIIEYAHEKGKKVYVAFNTLIKQNELPEAAQMAADLYELQPDAVIVQDIGIAGMLREYFPGLTIHASTQMGIHNSAGIAAAADLGIKRVILERQVTLEELELIMKNTELEVEVFGHGALCCSLSGGCLFSSWLGGWSGNRGRCKQPCRRRYYSSEGNGFFFSPQDMYTLDLVPEFKRLGIASLKIEGRLRKPDYTAKVTQAYRMALDAPELTGKILREARKILSGTYGRKWSHGFYTAESMKNLIQHDSPGTTGQLCAMVTDRADNGFTCNVKHRLHLGDRIRIQTDSGDEGTSLTITAMRVDGKSSTKAPAGKNCFIFCDKTVPFRGKVFKIGESLESYDSRVAQLPSRKLTLDLEVSASIKGVDIKILNLAGTPQKYFNCIVKRAQNRPLTPKGIAEGLKTPGKYKYKVNIPSINVDEGLFIPAGELKKVRLAMQEWLIEATHNTTIFSAGLEAMEQFRVAFTSVAKSPEVDLKKRYDETAAVTSKGCQPADKNCLLSVSIYDYNKKTSEVILPAFCPENRIVALRKRIDDAYEAGIRRFRVTSLYQFDLLRTFEDVFISTAFPLPVCNSLTIEQLSDFGVDRVQAWPELERAALEELRDASQLELEIYRYGRIPLLVTRAKIPIEGRVKDDLEGSYTVHRDNMLGVTYLYSREVFSIPRLAGTYDYYDLTNARWNDNNTSEFNYRHELM